MCHLSARTACRRVAGTLAAALLCAAGLAVPTASPVAADDAAPLLGNRLAVTAPMGFNNWNTTNCSAEFNEAMIKGIADIFVDRGLKAAGYEYGNLDDRWALPERDADGKLVPDPARFPNGVKAVAADVGNSWRTTGDISAPVPATGTTPTCSRSAMAA
jgi:alpha-galactosidase